MSDHESPFQAASTGDSPFQFSRVDGGVRISFQVDTVKGERQTKKARFDQFEMICDEGKNLGGDNTAPPPLAYFAAAIAF